jgi:hypothetical protein
VLPEHVVFHDHRRTGIGRIEGATEYIASVAALFEQIQHFDSETLYWVGIEPARQPGGRAHGGHARGRRRRVDLPRARKRFAKLRPRPS